MTFKLSLKRRNRNNHETMVSDFIHSYYELFYVFTLLFVLHFDVHEEQSVYSFQKVLQYLYKCG